MIGSHLVVNYPFQRSFTLRTHIVIQSTVQMIHEDEHFPWYGTDCGKKRKREIIITNLKS